MRKLESILVAGCVALAAAASHAVEIDAPALFTQLDANADGQLQSEEAPGEHARLFSRLLRLADENGDGKLSRDEWLTGLTPVRADKDMPAKPEAELPGAKALVVLLAKMDTSGDLELAADEIPEELRGLFQTMLARGDGDKNGRLAAHEMAQAGPVLAALAGAYAIRLRMDVDAELAMLPADRTKAIQGIGLLPLPAMGEAMADSMDSSARAPQAPAELFALLDANGDRSVSVDDGLEALTILVRRGDKNGDGKLSPDEFFAIGRTAGDGAARRPARDGGADPETIRNRVRQLLTTLDRDGNGELNRDELPPPLAGAFPRIDADGSGAVNRDELLRFLTRRQNRERREAMQDGK